jgi:23S rRNA (uracil1939-C5)-methyltransferase
MKRMVELEINDLAFNGKSVGYLDGKVTFVNGGLSGEWVLVCITKSKRSYNQAKLIRVLSRSPERIEPVCRHYDICGGCTWQDLDYERQLFYKRNQVVASLEHIGGFEQVEVAPINPSPTQFFYRNKMEFSFHVCQPEVSPDGFVLGLHERGCFDRIFNIVECHLESHLSNRVVNFVREKVPELGIPVYDLVAHRGFLRFLIFREGKNTGQHMLTLVTGKGEFVGKSELVEALVSSFPELTTIVWVVNSTITNIARGEVHEILHGPGFIEEDILGLRFRISPLSFFQTNSLQTENLYRTAIELAEIRPDDAVLDLYCGAGTIGMCLAPRAREVIGIDIEEEAIESARDNARLNGLDNCQFHSGPVRKLLVSEPLRDRAFDPVIIDPPRMGMHPQALQRVLEINPKRLIYISCNPATFARDAKELVGAGYELRKIIPFDMFPHTMHIELVSRFEKIC